MPLSDFQIALNTQLEERLRRCGTKGDPALRPYWNADIKLEHIEIGQIKPLAKYVLQEHLDRVANLQEKLTTVFTDLFDLTVGMVWPDGPTAPPLIPPVIEFWPDEGYLLVDGLHRVWSARKQGRTEVYCVVLRGVDIPLVPRPLNWENIKVFPLGERPTEDQKRVFRFSDPESLRSALPRFAEKVTVENYRYFLYRNLEELGSSGVRPVAEMSRRSQNENRRFEDRDEEY